MRIKPAERCYILCCALFRNITRTFWNMWKRNLAYIHDLHSLIDNKVAYCTL